MIHVFNLIYQFYLTPTILIVTLPSYLAYPRELRLPRMSNKAINRWFVAVTLIRNPTLIKYRQQGGVKSCVSLAGSINNDMSSLI